MELEVVQHDPARVAGQELSNRVAIMESGVLYLAMAKKLALPVITADRPMQERGARAYENIVLLTGISAH